MLSILPALLLLIFRGPAVAENPHLGAILPAGAVSRDLLAPQRSLHSLSDPVLATVLCRLFEEQSSRVALDSELSQTPTLPPYTPHLAACTYVECERSRDGPFGS